MMQNVSSPQCECPFWFIHVFILQNSPNEVSTWKIYDEIQADLACFNILSNNQMLQTTKGETCIAATTALMEHHFSHRHYGMSVHF